MSKFTEQMRKVGVHNSNAFAGKGNVYISYNSGNSRACQPSRWQVHRPGFKTDSTAHWMDYGSKSFLGRKQSGAFDEAKEWASERYGIKEWARTPFGDWMDAEFVKTRVAELKRLINDNLEAIVKREA